jgi:hypothetical protein
LPIALLAQNPYPVAGDHYHVILGNSWAQATWVNYAAHGRSPVHEHLATTPTAYIYATEGGPMRFHHMIGDRVGVRVDRPPAKAGTIRFARGAPVTNSVEYLGDMERPTQDVRLPPVSFDPTKSAQETQFENAHVRVVRVNCAAGESCPAPDHRGDPAITVTMNGPQRGNFCGSHSLNSQAAGAAQPFRDQRRYDYVY